MAEYNFQTGLVFDWPNVATSVSLFGTVPGVQFSAVFQSPLVGLRFQVALPANESSAISHQNKSEETPFHSLIPAGIGVNFK